MTTFHGEDGVRLFQMTAAKGAIDLESKGMQHSSGRSVRKHWALQMGLKASAKPEEVVAAIDKAIKELREKAAKDGKHLVTS